MKPGDWLTLAGTNFSAASPESTVIEMGDVTMEAAATAILSIMPLDAEGEDPIAFLVTDTEDDDLPDVAFAVRGIAADAELRRVNMSRLTEDEFGERAAKAVLTVRTGQGGGEHAFLLRKGALT
jgi:L-fucose mutarotase